MLPPLPLLNYHIDIQWLSGGSIVKDAAPLLPLATPSKNMAIAFAYRRTVV